MTPDEARAKGYELVRASAIEMGLLKHGKGVRTWWNSSFTERPDLGHPLIQEAIRICEENPEEWPAPGEGQAKP